MKPVCGHVNPKCYFESISGETRTVINVARSKPRRKMSGKQATEQRDDAYCTHVNDLIFHQATPGGDGNLLNFESLLVAFRRPPSANAEAVTIWCNNTERVPFISLFSRQNVHPLCTFHITIAFDRKKASKRARVTRNPFSVLPSVLSRK